MAKTWTLLLVAALAVGLLAADADAKKRKKRKPLARTVVTQTQTASVPSRSEGTVSATCPPGTTLLGGGFASSPYTAFSGSNFVVDSHRTGTSTWTIRSVNNSTAAGTLTVDAYCRRVDLALTEVASSATLPAGGFGFFPSGFTEATCPAGQYAVAGGFTSSAAISGTAFAGPYPFSSYRTAREKWRVDALNTTSSARTYTALAYCSPLERAELAALTSVAGTNAPVAIDTQVCPRTPSPKRKGKARRKRKRKRAAQLSVLSGGFATPAGLGGTPIRAIFVSQARTVNGVWHTAGVSVGDGPATLYGYAYCG